MAVVQNKNSSSGAKTSVSTSFNSINTSDYGLSTVQNNIALLNNSLSTNINSQNNNVVIAQITSDLNISANSVIIWQSALYDPYNAYIGNGVLQTIFNGVNTINAAFVVSGTSNISIYLVYQGSNAATIYSGTPGSSGLTVNFTTYANLTSGENIWLYLATNNATILGSETGIGSQFSLRW